MKLKNNKLKKQVLTQANKIQEELGNEKLNVNKYGYNPYKDTNKRNMKSKGSITGKNNDITKNYTEFNKDRWTEEMISLGYKQNIDGEWTVKVDLDEESSISDNVNNPIIKEKDG